MPLLFSYLSWNALNEYRAGPCELQGPANLDVVGCLFDGCMESSEKGQQEFKYAYNN